MASFESNNDENNQKSQIYNGNGLSDSINKNGISDDLQINSDNNCKKNMYRDVVTASTNAGTTTFKNYKCDSNDGGNCDGSNDKIMHHSNKNVSEKHVVTNKIAGDNKIEELRDPVSDNAKKHNQPTQVNPPKIDPNQNGTTGSSSSMEKLSKKSSKQFDSSKDRITNKNGNLIIKLKQNF